MASCLAQCPPYLCNTRSWIRNLRKLFTRLRRSYQEPPKDLMVFGNAIRRKQRKQYKHHWFPDRPCKGSGYRCIRINHKMDPVVGQAAQRIGLSIQQLYQLLPSELTLWVDPFEVSYRIGEDGSICVLYESQPVISSQIPVSSSLQMVESHISCKEELRLGRTIPSKTYNMMTVSS